MRLSNRNGGSGDNFTNTVFDDEAATAISPASRPFTGSFRPFQPLSAFDGQAIAGTWTLRGRPTWRRRTSARFGELEHADARLRLLMSERSGCSQARSAA